jgi:hypothetical protein
VQAYGDSAERDQAGEKQMNVSAKGTLEWPGGGNRAVRGCEGDWAGLEDEATQTEKKSEEVWGRCTPGALRMRLLLAGLGGCLLFLR